MHSRWTSRRAVVFHVEVLLVVTGCVVATWWQLGRAIGGHGLSWFYTFEWPLLAVLAVWGWWHLLHEDTAAYRARRKRPPEWDFHGDDPSQRVA